MDDMLLCPLQLLTRVIYHDASLYGKTKLYISEDNIFVLFVKRRKENKKEKWKVQLYMQCMHNRCKYIGRKM